MDDLAKASLSRNIEDKLDEFFGENEERQLANNKNVLEPMLEKLKSIVLSIDWEITDECLNDLIAEADVLIRVFEKDRPVNALLRMLKALSAYIRKHKAQAHQGAIKKIMSVFSSLESIIQMNTNDEDRKKEIVTAEIREFNLLKEQIIVKQALKKSADVTPIIAQEPPKKEIHEVQRALSALESQMNAQIEQLKMQLSLIKKELSHYNND